MSMQSGDWGQARSLEAISGEVAIVGVGEAIATAAGERSGIELAGDAVAMAIADAGLHPRDIDTLMIQPHYDRQFGVADYHRRFGTNHDILVSETGGAMTWAATAPYEAAMILRRGEGRTMLNIFSIDWASQRASGTGGPGDWHRGERMKAAFELPFGFYPQPIYFAATTRRYAHEYSLDEASLASIAVSARKHAAAHPTATLRQKPLTIDDYLAQPMLFDPLRKADCCLVSDGAGAYVMTAADRARDLPHPPVTVLGVGAGEAGSGVHFTEQGDFCSTPQYFAAPGAFRMAGLEPGDVDVASAYDPFTIVSLMQIEDMGFCAKGDAGQFVLGDRLDFRRGRANGGLPFNTHGGLLAHSYLLGIAHVVEIVRQLRGTGANQVDDARIGVYGGYTGVDAATLILGRA